MTMRIEDDNENEKKTTEQRKEGAQIPRVPRRLNY